MAVPWKMGYFRVDEMVVERGFLPGNCLEEEDQDPLGLVEIYWVSGDNKEKVFDHWNLVQLVEGLQ